MSKSTIFDFAPLTKDEMSFLLFPTIDVSRIRMSKGVAFEHLEDLLSKEEYLRYKSKEDKMYDLFLLFRHRGYFEKAKEYEILCGYNAVKSIETKSRDLFIKNELEYYEWRKQNP